MITNFTASLLRGEKEVDFYTDFVRKYSIHTVSVLVMQTFMNPEACAEPDDFKQQISQFVNNIEISEEEYVRNRILMTGMHLQVPDQVQVNENRQLLSTEFRNILNKNKMQDYKLILHHLNSNAFLGYFSLFEDCIKQELIRYGFDKRDMPERDLIKNLRSKLEKDKTFDFFLSEINNRSLIFTRFEQIIELWKVLAKIRNLLVHANGIISTRWSVEFFQLVDKFMLSFGKKGDPIILISLHDALVGNELSDGDFFIVNDKIENICRNFIIYVMESLYVVEPVPLGAE